MFFFSLALQPLLFAEVKQLRLIAQKRNPHIARILHSGVLEISTAIENNNIHAAAVGGGLSSLLLDSGESNGSNNSSNLLDYLCIAEESGSVGDLYSYIYTYKHTQKQQNHQLNHHQQHLQSHNSTTLFTDCDLQNIFVQLLEAVLTLHDLNLTHGDIRPRTVLVTDCMDRYNPRQFKNRSQQQGEDSNHNINGLNDNRNSNGNKNGIAGDKQHVNNMNNANSHDDMDNSDSNMLIMKLCGCTPQSISNYCTSRDGTPDVCKYCTIERITTPKTFKITSNTSEYLFYYTHLL